MTPFLFFYTVSIFLVGVINLALGFWVISKSRQLIHLLYFLITLAFFCVAVSEILFRIAANPASAAIWAVYWLLAWFAVYAFFLHFTVVFSGQTFRLIPFFYLAVLVMSGFRIFVPEIFLAGFSKHYYGYTYIIAPGGWSLPIFFSVYSLGALFLVYQVYLTAKEYYRRVQARMILLAVLLPLAIGMLIDVVMIGLGLPVFPISIYLTAIMVGLSGHALIRYQLIAAASKEQIAEAVAQALLDPMLLTDHDGEINYANPAACRLTGYRIDELVGLNIKRIFPTQEPGIRDLIRKDKIQVLAGLRTFPLANNRGYIYLARDLTPITRLRLSTQEASAEAGKLIEREQRIARLLFSFSGLQRREDVEELWRQVEQEELAVQAILKPIYIFIREYTRILAETKKAKDELAKRTQEIETLNQYMAGREKVFKELEKAYEGIKE